jgi:hypothetical protein
MNDPVEPTFSKVKALPWAALMRSIRARFSAGS